MILKEIRLELGRTDGFPDGDPSQGYEFARPLTAAGHLDATAWAEHREACTVRHFEDGEDLERGRLQHVGHGWHFAYGSKPGSGEPIFKLDHHLISPGLYVSITEHDGVQRPFKIVSVTPAGTPRKAGPAEPTG